MIYVKLRDGRGWVFETLHGKKVLERVALSSMEDIGDAGPAASGSSSSSVLEGKDR